MSYIPRLLALAKSQVGIKERTNKNDGQPSENFMGGRQEPWCAHFIAWLFRMVGKPIPGDVVPNTKRANPLAGVEFMERVFKEHEWFFSEPKVGDIIFFKTRSGSDTGPGRHCGLVVEVNENELTTIEGNYSHSVTYVSRPYPDRLISGFGRRPE